jgi:hypothetical protein
MTVTERLTRQENTPGTLVGVHGGGASAEARAWLAGRLRWEERLHDLEHAGANTRRERTRRGGMTSAHLGIDRRVRRTVA